MDVRPGSPNRHAAAASQAVGAYPADVLVRG